MVFTVPKTLTEAHLRRVLDKEESDGRFPNAEVKNAQDQGRRYFAGLHQGSEAELVAWEARQAYIGMGVPPLRRGRHGHRLDGARRH